MGLLDKVFDQDDDKDRKRAEAARPASAASPAPRFDDVRTGSSSTAPDPKVAPSSTMRKYTVVAGDSLSKIAKREYGDAGKWPAIFEANRDKIQNPDLIHPGQVLTIPPQP
jgi:nucleoid-associated protein YgaU